MTDKTKMQRVSQQNPCPICGKPDWCLIAEDGSTAICQRIEEGSVKRCGDAGWLHILSKTDYNGQEMKKQFRHNFVVTDEEADFGHIANLYRSQLTDGELQGIADQLQISPASLRRLNIGWDGEAFTFPMSNDFGKVIGIRRRFPDGRKTSVTESKTGLFIPSGLTQTGPLLITEGPTDCGAAMDLGFAAIGRPNCNSKVDMTVEYCKGRSEIIVIGDNDPVGRTGAERLAGALVQNGSNVKLIYPPEGIKDLRDWIHADLTPEQLNARIDQSDYFKIAVESENEWEPPAPLGHFDLPVFPLEAFPDELCVLSEFCAAVAESYQVPVDLPAMLILAIGGASLAKRIVIHVQGDHWEPVNLFTVIALPPANRKSQTFRAVTEPLVNFERREAERLAPMIEQNQNQRMILEKSLKHAQDQAAKAQKAEDARRNREKARDLIEELRELEIIKTPQYIGDDATPESVALLLNDNGGRFALLSPEGDIFDLMAGRYSTNGMPNIGVYLKGHAGDDIRVNRANRDYPARFVQKPALTIGVAVQPEVLRGLTLKKGFRGRGLLGRFLYSLPQSLLGYRKLNSSPVNSTIANAYQNIILDALMLPPSIDPDGNPCPHVVTVSRDALKELDWFAMEIEKQLAPNGDFASMGDWAGKLVGAVCRIAGIFHGLIHAGSGNPAMTQIEAETILGAITIGQYLIPHAKAAFFEMGTDPTIDTARKILDWSSTGEITTFSRREAFNSLRGGIQKVDELDMPLEILVNHGYIREIPQDRQGPGRKPSQKYQVNPLWLSQNTQNTHKSPVDLDSADSAQFAQEVGV